MKTNIRYTGLLLCTVAFLPLTACQTTSDMSAQDRSDKVGAVLERAANDASQSGNTAESLALLERSYKHDSGNQETAVKYAHALRSADRLNRAALVLSPFIEDGSANAGAHTEYGAILAATGSYPEAEMHSRKALEMAPESAQAYHVLGIALDAQGQHKPAEEAFRKGLEYWEGDPSPILNNLGLNLASQGFIDEAIDTLRKAAATAPGRADIERNLRIVSALQTQPPQSGFHLVPRPARKPDRA